MKKYINLLIIGVLLIIMAVLIEMEYNVVWSPGLVSLGVVALMYGLVDKFVYGGKAELKIMRNKK